MHRLVMDTPPDLVCDHINHDGLDNRKQNLRNCTTRQNSFNRPSNRGSFSKFKGVSYRKNEKNYTACISINGKPVRLGVFKDEESAAWAYDEAAKKYQGQFAFLNFPENPTKVEG